MRFVMLGDWSLLRIRRVGRRALRRGCVSVGCSVVGVSLYRFVFTQQYSLVKKNSLTYNPSFG